VANSDITLGAQIRAIGNAIGMSEDQVIQMVVGAQRKGGRQLGRDIGTDEAQAAVLRRLQKVQGVNADIPANIDEYRTISNREVEFGEFGNQDELQNFGGRDGEGRIKNVDQQIKEREQAAGKKDSNVLSRSFFEKGKEGLQREEMYIPDGMPVPERFVEAAKDRDFGIYQEGVNAPAAQIQRMERDILQQGVDQFGADAFPGAADVIGRIEDDIYGNRGAEQSLVREMIGQDINGLPTDEIRRRADLQLGREFYQPDGGIGAPDKDYPQGRPFKRVANVAAMPIDAYKIREQQILSELGGIKQNPVMKEVNNIEAQIEARRLAKEGYPDAGINAIGQIQKIGHAKIGNDFRVSQNDLDIGRNAPIALPLNLPDQYNAPTTDNRFAGPLQKQEQFIVDNMPGYRESGAFGDFPNVGINEQIGLARRAIENAKIKGQKVSLGDMQIRNAADLQAAANQVIGLAQKRGQPFFNNVEGKNVVNLNPGIREVLERGGMNARGVGDVAKAMFMLEAAAKNPANQGRKEAFARGESVNLDRPVGFGGEHPALGGGEARIAMLNREKIEGKEVKAQLQKLDGRQGNPGEPLNQQELGQARMPFQAGVAGQEIPRARFVRGEDRALSSDQIYEKYGPVNGQIANDVIRRQNAAQGIQSDGFSMPKADPIAAQKTARMQQPLSGITYNETAPDAWSTQPATGAGITQEVQKRLAGAAPQAALPYGIDTSGSTQGPARAPRQGPTQGPRRERTFGERRDYAANKIKGYATSPRFQTSRRRGYAAGGAVAGLAGLDALIGGERDNREQEQYQ